MQSQFRFIVVGIMLLISTASVYGQGPNQTTSRQRPYRGLFGGGPAINDQSLSVNGSLGGGYDTNVLASDAFNFGSTGSKAGIGSTVALANGGVSYTLSRQRISLSGNANTSAQYYRTLENPLVQRHAVGAGGSWLLTPRTNLSGQVSMMFDPFYSLLPGVPNGVAPDVAVPEVPVADTSSAVQHEQHRTLQSALQLTHALTSRVSLEGEASFYETTSDSQEFDLTSRELGARVRWQLSRDLALRLGYRYGETTFAESAVNPESKSEMNTIDAGVDYNHTFSLSRRTTLGIGTGFTGVSHDGETTYSLLGHVSLNHDIGRTWRASTGYGRDVQFVEVLRRPAFTDSVFGRLDGMLARRVRAASSVSYQRGSPVGDAEPYYSAQGAASLSYNVTNYLSTAVEYSYFWYDFSQTVEASRLPEQTHRHSIRALLQVWAPIFQRPRRPNATR